MSVTITGVDEVIRLMQQVDKVSQSVVTRAAKAGANIVKKDAKANAPVRSGALKKSITMKAEKRKKGKKVYDIKFVGENLVKISKSGKRSFYPVSQEYGWMTKSGKKIIPKKAGYLRNAIKNNRTKVQQTMIDVMKTELEKVRQ